MDISITPKKLTGEIGAIPSKSDAHRLLICAALSDEKTVLTLPLISKDIAATISCLRSVGADIEVEGKRVTISPVKKVPDRAELDCYESGSTLRFMLPVAAAMGINAVFKGSGRLPERPIGELTKVLSDHGIEFSSPKLPFEIKGKLSPGKYEIAGNISSQYITGLLLALPMLGGKSDVVLTTKLESAPYVDITLSALERFGVIVEKTEKGYAVDGADGYHSPKCMTVDGDWSNSAFFLTAGAMNGPVCVTGLSDNSPQGDKKVLEILKYAGAEVKKNENGITVKSAKLKASRIDITEIPDLLPILAVFACACEGKTEFYGGRRLRLKESDRLVTTACMINALGGAAEETEDGLIVFGKSLSGGTVDSFNDHRIVMAAAVASVMCSGPVVIKDAQAADKSYPTFFEDFRKLGGEADVI